MAATQLAESFLKCRIADCRVLLGNGDDRKLGICLDCMSRPEGRRLMASLKRPGPHAVATPPARPRPFTIADKALIKNMHGFTPAADLLRILNERLVLDVGGQAAPYTLEQLHEETRGLADGAKANDWAGLRQLLARARRAGVLDAVTREVLEDFAVVFGLTPAQAIHLHDVISGAQHNG